MDAGRGRAVWVAVQLRRSGERGSARIIRCGRSAAIVNGALAALSGGVRGALRPDGPTLDPAGEAAAGDAVAGVLFDPLGAAVDGAAGVRPAVPLVRGPGRGRRGVGSLDVLQEPRPAAGGRDRRQVPGRGAGAAAGEAPARTRALLGRRHADRGLGRHEELPAEGRLGRAAGAGRRAQRRGGFPRPEAHQRDPRLDDRSGRPALSQGAGQGGQALLHGPCADGEPQRPGRRRLPDPGQRPCRADRGAAHDRAARRPAEAHHAGRRQGLTTPRTSSTSCAR